MDRRRPRDGRQSARAAGRPAARVCALRRSRPGRHHADVMPACHRSSGAWPTLRRAPLRLARSAFAVTGRVVADRAACHTISPRPEAVADRVPREAARRRRSRTPRQTCGIGGSRAFVSAFLFRGVSVLAFGHRPASLLCSVCFILPRDPVFGRSVFQPRELFTGRSSPTHAVRVERPQTAALRAGQAGSTHAVPPLRCGPARRRAAALAGCDL